MDPDLRVVLHGRVCDEPQLVSGVQMLEMAVPAGENRPVNG